MTTVATLPSTRLPSVRLYPLKGHFNGHSHDRRLRRTPFAWPDHHVCPVNAGNVQNDPVVFLVVDDAPRVSGIRVAAFEGPVLGRITDPFQTTDFRAFAAGPVMSG
jgi:hypothetical protein